MHCVRLFIITSIVLASAHAEEEEKPDPTVAKVSGISATTVVPKQISTKDKLAVELTFTMRVNYTYVFSFASVSFTFSNISTGENFVAQPPLLPYREVDRVPVSEQAMKTIKALPDVVHYQESKNPKTGKKELVVYRCMYLNPSESHTLTMPLASFQEQGETKQTVKALPPGTYNVMTNFACQGKAGKAAAAISWWAGSGSMVTTMEVTK
jgi:hypothetical protein